jgi:hypothetical protein
MELDTVWRHGWPKYSANNSIQLGYLISAAMQVHHHEEEGSNVPINSLPTTPHISNQEVESCRRKDCLIHGSQ